MTDQTTPYDDIIHLPHPTSDHHPRMSTAERAAQFSPFAALTSYGDVIRETARPTDRKIELDEEARAELDRRLRLLSSHVHPQVTITYFLPDDRKTGGVYMTVTGTIKRIDDVGHSILLTDGSVIPAEDVLEIT